MANIAVTYTFTNGTTADASQVNQNFQDVIDGTSDGTKDLSISSLTVGGTTTLNGAINMGNGSIDDITVTGSLASSIPIKTTNAYDIGAATLGLRALYFGANSQTVNIKGSASMSSTWTMTLPVSVPSADGSSLISTTAGVTSWLNTFDPTTFSDIQATAKGVKGYLADLSAGPNDIAYNGGVKATITKTAGNGTMSSVPFAVLYPYKTSAGTWRLRGNIQIAVSSTSRTSIEFSINGITTVSFAQPGAGCADPNGDVTANSSFKSGTNALQWFHSAVTVSTYQVSFDIALASAPTWAYV